MVSCHLCGQDNHQSANKLLNPYLVWYLNINVAMLCDEKLKEYKCIILKKYMYYVIH